ncbi:hypothetical protein K3495_g14580 [Podosphaera aphanis]|nr:hypothetical protein K3495_g14580 [Podosphaera aphanis]
MLPAEPEKLTPKEIPLEKGDEYQPQPIIARQKGVKQPRQKYAAIRPMRADVNRRVQNSELLNPVSRPQEAREASDQRNLQAENRVEDLPTALVEQETPTKLVEQTNHREHKNKTPQIIQIAPEQSMVEQTSSSLPKSSYVRPLRKTAKEVFNRFITANAVSAQAVHINEGESSSIQVPTPPFESITVEQAMHEDPELWKEAIKSELISLKKTGTYTILSGSPPPGKKLISSKIVLRKKFKGDGTLSRRKARIVIRGFEQEYGIDYFV